MGAALVAGCARQGEVRAYPAIESGVLDLRDWDFDRDGPVRLNGKWAFYWDRLLAPADFARGTIGPTGYYPVPLYWTKYEGLGLPGRGMATYRLTVLAKGAIGEIAIKTPELYTEYRLWVNGAIVDEHGTVAGTGIRFLKPNVFALNVAGSAIDIVLQIKNEAHGNAGIGQNFVIGTAADLFAKRYSVLILEVALSAICFFLGCHHLVLFSFRRAARELLFFGLFCVAIAMRTLLTGETFVMTLLPDFPFAIASRLSTSSIPLMAITFIFFAGALFPALARRAVVYAIAGVHGLYLVMIWTTPTYWYSYAFQHYLHAVTLCMLVILYWVVRSIIAGNRLSYMFLVACGVLFVGAYNDMLFYQQLVDTGYYLSLGFTGFIIIESVMLGIRFSQEYATIRRLSDRLQAVDSLKDEFLANTSHELRTPLNGIIGITESLIDGATGPLPENTVRNLNLIVSSGRRLGMLINDILDFSKMRHDEIVLNRRPTDLRAIVDLVLLTSRSLLKSKPVQMFNRIPADIPLVFADENRLQQVLYNLVGNAIKFTHAGEIAVSARVEAGAPGADMVVVTVSDTGIGVPPDEHDAIFESFRQADGSTARLYGGTGLGLAITRTLVELHGGTIGVESEHGKGAAFSFSLPVATGVADGEIVASETQGIMARVAAVRDALVEDPDALDATPQRATDAEAKGKILVVDDDAVNQKVLANHLLLHGYEVRLASDGFQALELVDGEGGFDLVLLDVMMPRLSGYEVCQRIRERHAASELPVIMLTAKNLLVDLIKGLDTGANDYLGKPFNKRELIARVRTHISLKKASQEARRLYGIDREMKIAREIQMSIVPESLPAVPGLCCAARYLPMAGVGGDLYCVDVTDDGAFAVLFTDVSGHGVPSALIASMVKIAFEVQKPLAARHDCYLQELNRILIPNIRPQFLTACYLYIEPAERRLHYSNAAHPPLLIHRRETGELLSFKPRGKLLGVVDDIACSSEEIPLRMGDRLVLYTDGITEALEAGSDKKLKDVEAHMFGTEAFTAAIRSGAERPAGEFADHLLAELERWTGTNQFNDDVTLMVIDVE